MYIYEGTKIDNPVYIHFLCGSKYNKNDISDKRNVLKMYIDSIEHNYAIILEGLFNLSEYDSLKFKDLEEVELMISNFARSIIIFQETVSTAAEIALFGSKENLKNKILVVYAPKNIVKTNCVGAFIENAYFKEDKVKKMKYSFKAKRVERARGKIAYYNTLFQNNQLDDIFANELDFFWKKLNPVYDICLKKYFPKILFSNYYKISDKTIEVVISYDLIFSLISCILCNQSLIRDKRNLENCISSICTFIKNVMIDTVCYRESLDKEEYSGKVRMDNGIDINQPIKFLLNIFWKMNLINFLHGKISVSRAFSVSFADYKNLIVYLKDVNFFEDSDCNES